MANILEFRKVLQPSDMSVNGVATLDGSTRFATPLQLPSGNQPKLQVCAITISDRIPNVFNAAPYYTWDNTLLVYSTAGAVITPPTIIQLPRGLYSTVEEIADAINAALDGAGLYANVNDPTLTITGNVITDVVTVTMKPGKLAAAFYPGGALTTLTLDFRKTTSNTDLATTLGFAQGLTAVFDDAALHKYNSTLEVKLDTQGTACDIQSSLITLRRRNEAQVRALAIIPFAGKTSISDTVWPSAGQISPILVYEGIRSVSQASFEVRTMTGRPMLFMSGAIHIVISFIF